MSRPSERSTTTERVREHFQRQARSFDALYDEDHPLQRAIRPGLHRRRDLAAAVVRSMPGASVLDVGCGSGRIGEVVLDAGAGLYVGIDLSAPMLALAAERLARFGDRVELDEGDFHTAELDGPLDVILALGLFDYVANPERFVHRMADLCTGTVVASFPRWTFVKGPVRKVRYEVVNDCPIYNYTERELRLMFGAAGFAHVDLHRGSSGYLLRAVR
jgi:2-polyprenyl-3-methyl-5-hydroxy-6-metoxy-1,4-benzoquinol methylase